MLVMMCSEPDEEESTEYETDSEEGEGDRLCGS
jgi:hypothetical protein